MVVASAADVVRCCLTHAAETHVTPNAAAVITLSTSSHDARARGDQGRCSHGRGLVAFGMLTADTAVADGALMANKEALAGGASTADKAVAGRLCARSGGSSWQGGCAWLGGT